MSNSGRTKGALEAIRFGGSSAFCLDRPQHHMTGGVDSEVDLRSRSQRQLIANVFRNGDLTFAGE